MSKKEILLKQVGITEDKKIVVSGIYNVFQTHGIPLNIIFHIMNQQGFIPCWISFYQEAKVTKLKHERIISKLEEALYDSYGKEFGDVVISTLNKIYMPTS